jgi:Domain of unknown function (DUF4158)
VSRRSLLSPEQRARLFGIPTDHAEMAKYYVLSAEDLALIRPNGAAPTGSASPSNYASCVIPDRAWNLTHSRRRR